MRFKYINEFRDGDLARKILSALNQLTNGIGTIRLMEICGTHTMAIFRSGLRELLPGSIKLISGPGCPVCVTPNEDIDRAVWLSQQSGVIIATFGDLMRVPGSYSSIQAEQSLGAKVQLVYSSMDALEIARDNPNSEVVFLGIGFETTAPTVAAAIQQAAAEKLNNFSVFSMHKLLPPVMQVLLQAEDLKIDGFLCPGHVSMVIGAGAYQEIATKYGIPCVVAGFEPLDILLGIYFLVEQARQGTAKVVNQYRRGVALAGNPVARQVMNMIFKPSDAVWRGLGHVAKSGLEIRSEWEDFDAVKRFSMPEIRVKEDPGCSCGEILRGVLAPPECPLFGRACSPQNPKGPCMVSSEGTCGVYYRYHN